jgi:hypothetical protein
MKAEEGGHDYVPQAPPSYGKPPPGWRRRMYDVIFEADTSAGRRFDIALVIAIMLSILVVVLDSVPNLHREHGTALHLLEWMFTLLFTVEYGARILAVQRPWRYATGFYGIIDLLAVLPTYFSLLVPGSAVLLDIRILRLLRVFRIFKLTLYIEETTRLGEALAASRRKIMVFLSVVMMAILILGTLMYVVEGAGERLHQHSRRHVLGHRHHDDRRLRRHHPAHAPGQGDRLVHDAARLGHPGGADGHRHCRDDAAPRRPPPGAGAAAATADAGACLPGLRDRRP